MDNCYLLREKKILLYGAGDMAKRVTETLRKTDISVYAYIDRRASAYGEYCGKQVYDPESVATWKNKCDYVIIITIKNAFAHNDIAAFFLNAGFLNLLFRPLYVLKGATDNATLNAVMAIHDELTDGRVFHEGLIPDLTGQDIRLLPDTSLIERDSSHVRLYVPAETLFQRECLSDYDNRIYYNFLVSAYAVRMYEDFWNAHLDSDRPGLEEYIQKAEETARRTGMAVNDGWYANFIDGKINVYHNMCNQLMLKPSFFADNCANVSYHEPGVFTVDGTGKNRVSFLIAHDYKYIPVRMTVEDYNAFMNMQQCQNALAAIAGGDHIAPVSHPCCYEQNIAAGDYLRLWLKRTGRLIFEEMRQGWELSDIRCLDMMADDGATSRFLYMLGLDTDRMDHPRTSRVDQLFHMNIPSYSELEDLPPKRYSVFLFSNYGAGEELLLDAIDRYAAERFLCFVLVWNDISFCSELQKRGCEKVCSLFHTMWQGKKVAGYCFRHPQPDAESQLKRETENES